MYKRQLQGSVAKTVGDTDIYYYSYTNKVVPADYELTDADKAAKANGDLVFSLSLIHISSRAADASSTVSSFR